MFPSFKIIIKNIIKQTIWTKCEAIFYKTFLLNFMLNIQVSEETNSALTFELSSMSNLSSEFEKCFNEKEEIRNEKMMLENECSDLKEKLENLLKDFGVLKLEMQNKESNELNAAKEAIEVNK